MPTPLLVMAPRMPATRVPCQELLALSQLGEQRVLHVRRRHPVARVGGVRVAPVTVVGGEEIALRIRADHVVAGQQAVGGGTAQVRMVEAHPGIELGDHDAVAAGGQVPGFHGIDRRRLRVLQVPLPGEQRDHRAAPARSGAGPPRRTPPAGPRAGVPASARRSLPVQRAAAGCRRRCGAYRAPATRRAASPHAARSSPAGGAQLDEDSAPPGRSRQRAACCATAEAGSSATSEHAEAPGRQAEETHTRTIPQGPRGGPDSSAQRVMRVRVPRGHLLRDAVDIAAAEQDLARRHARPRAGPGNRRFRRCAAAWSVRASSSGITMPPLAM